MALHNERLYHTEDEIEHINGIGKRVHKEHRSSLSRMKLLKNYLAGCLVRRRWDHLDRERIIAHLEERISVEGGAV